MEILLNWFLPIFYVTVFSVIIMRSSFFRISGVKPIYLVVVYLIKFICGICLAWIYSHLYADRATGDAFRFFDDAKIFYSALPAHPMDFIKLLLAPNTHDPALAHYLRATMSWDRHYYVGIFNDNVTMIKVNALVMLFSFGVYHVHTAFFCFFSMIGLTALFKIFCHYFPDKKSSMFLAVFLIPSVLFWGSGVLKEALHLLPFGLAIYSALKIFDDRGSWKNWLILILSLALLLFLKGYTLIALIPALLSLMVLKIWGARYYGWKVLGVHGALFIILVGLAQLGPNYNVISVMQQKQRNYYGEALASDAHSLIDIPRFHSFGEWLKIAPGALGNALFRPFPWEIKGALYLFAALENIAFFGALLFMLWNFRPPSITTFPLVMLGLSFSLILLLLIGSVVPVLGSLVRYKVPALPFVWMLTFAFTNRRLLGRRLPRFRKLQKFIE